MLQSGDILLKRGNFCRGPGGVGLATLDALDLDTQLFELVVDIPDVLLFDGVDIVQRVLGPGMEFEEFRPGPLKALGDDFAVLSHRRQKAEKRAPFIPFQIHRLPRKRMAGHQAVVHPAKIGTVQVAVGNLELRPVLFPTVADRLRNKLLSPDRPQELVPVLEVNGSESVGPEEPERIGSDDPDEGSDHEQTEGQGSPRQPDERVAAAEKTFEHATPE